LIAELDETLEKEDVEWRGVAFDCLSEKFCGRRTLWRLIFIALKVPGVDDVDFITTTPSIPL
jgi:hypothetical protein